MGSAQDDLACYRPVSIASDALEDAGAYTGCASGNAHEITSSTHPMTMRCDCSVLLLCHHPGMVPCTHFFQGFYWISPMAGEMASSICSSSSSSFETTSAPVTIEDRQTLLSVLADDDGYSSLRKWPLSPWWASTGAESVDRRILTIDAKPSMAMWNPIRF